jgi:hypothetical protein
MTEHLNHLIKTLSSSWSDELWNPVSGECLNTVIKFQIESAKIGNPSSLPFFSSNKVTWVTFGLNQQDVRLYYSRIKNWCIPCFARASGFVDPKKDTGALQKSLLNLSPAGYFKWENPPAYTETIFKKIDGLRKLQSNIPPVISQLEKTITQLRQEFATGLAINDRETCEVTITEVKYRGLDTAANILAMQIHMLWHFGEYSKITELQDLDLLLSTNTPKHVRRIILSALHIVYCSTFEEQRQYENALHSYQSKIEPLIVETGSNLIPDNEACAKLHVYSQLTGTKDVDNNVKNLIIDKNFLEWVSIKSRTHYQANVHAQSRPGTDARKPNWNDCLDYILNKDTVKVALLIKYLQEMPKPAITEIMESEILLSIFSNPEVVETEQSNSLAERILTAIVETLILFPDQLHQDTSPLFANLLDIWANKKSHLNDSQYCNFLMYLANGALEIDPSQVNLVHSILVNWWDKMPIRARLPWLIEAIEILSNQTSNQSVLELWYKGADLIQSDPTVLTRTDKEMMINLASRLGIEKENSISALGLQSRTATTEQEDPLTQTSLSRIAIVSLHERSANVAAEIIRNRSGCEVLVVNSHENDHRTKAATEKELILFVWSATKHSVYRAFDAVREKLCYVQGSGAASIVRSLEHHLLRMATLQDQSNK